MIKKSKREFYTDPSEFYYDTNEDGISDKVNSFLCKVVDYPEDEINGSITIRIFNFNDKSNKVSKDVAYPINPNSYTKPIPNQIVKVVEIHGDYYYYGVFNKSINKQNPDFVFDFLTDSEVGTEDGVNSENYTDRMEGNISPQSQNNKNLKEFKISNQSIPVIKEKSGDTIINGSKNNNIVLSYTENENEPYISFLIDRDKESYNENDKGIQIYNKKDIDNNIKYSCDIQKNKPTNESNSGGIIINNDKIRLNSNTGSIFLSSNMDFTVSVNNNINFDSNKKINIKSKDNNINLETESGIININSSKNTNIKSNNSINIEASKNINMSATRINLGQNASEPLVLGNQLVSILQELITALSTLTVTCSSPGSPSSPPINAPQFQSILTKLNTILSKRNKTQ